MPKVFVSQFTNHNVAPATGFGEIEIVARHNYPRFGDSSEHTKSIRDVVRNFNNNEDYLLIVGDPINIGYIIHILLEKGPFQCLKWDNLAGKYIPVVVK